MKYRINYKNKKLRNQNNGKRNRNWKIKKILNRKIKKILIINKIYHYLKIKKNDKIIYV